MLVGVILDTLEEKVDSKTILLLFLPVITDGKWAKKLVYSKIHLGKKVLRYLLLLVVPLKKSGRTDDQPVALIDIFPTLVDYCDLEGDHKLNTDGGALGGYSMKSLNRRKFKMERTLRRTDYSR